MGDQPPAPLLQVSDTTIENGRVNHDAGNAGLCARRVFEDKVFDVNACFSQLTEQAPERTRLIGNKNLDLGVPRRRSTVLARNAGHTLVAGGHHSINGSDASAAQRTQLSRGVEVRQQVIEIAAQLAQNRRHGARITRKNRSPQTRVGPRDTRGVTQALTGQAERLSGGIDKPRGEHR